MSNPSYSFSTEATEYGRLSSYYAPSTSSGPGPGPSGVSQIVAGSGITVSPTGGQGVVTIAQTGGPGVVSLNGQTGACSVTSTDGTVTITTPTPGNVNLSIPTAKITKYIPTGGADVSFPVSGGVTVMSISDVTVGKIYSYNILAGYANAVDGGGIRVNPAVINPQIYYRWYFQGAQPPGGTLAVAPVISASATDLSNLIYTAGATQGAVLAENYSGFFQVVSLPVTLILEVDTSMIGGAPSPPFMAANSIKVLGNASQLNLAIMSDSF